MVHNEALRRREADTEADPARAKVSEMEDSVEFSKRLQRHLLGILAERSTLSEAQIQRRWARKEWWLDAEEALSLGLADEIR